MDLAVSMQSLKNVFRFPIHAPRWQNKFLIGAALVLASYIVPLIPMLPLLGYFARMMRAGARNDDPAVLPEWDNWGDLFLDGLRQFVVLFIASLPVTIILIFGYAVYIGAFVALPFMGNRDIAGAWTIIWLISFGVFFVSIALSMLLLLLTLVIFPSAMAHVAVTRSLGSFFKVGEWWRIMRKNFLGFQVALGIFGALYLLLMVTMQILYLSLVLCVFIPLLLAPMIFYTGLVYYRLIGQAYGEMLAPVEDALPVVVGKPSPVI